MVITELQESVYCDFMYKLFYPHYIPFGLSNNL